MSELNTQEASQELPQTEPQKKPFHSLGERITHIGTYVGVDWFFNAAAGVGFAFWGDRTEGGRKVWSKPINEFFQKVLRPWIKSEENVIKSAGYGNTFMSIIVGGMMTIPPLLVLEHNPVKKAITKFFDRMIYGNAAVDNDPKFQEMYHEIDTAPKKDFLTGMGTRFLSLAPLLAAVLIPATSKPINKHYFDNISNITKRGAHAIGIRPKKLMVEKPGLPGSDWDYIHHSLAMDFGLGPWYALLHGITYDFFSGRKDTRKKELEYAREHKREIQQTTSRDDVSEVENTKFDEKNSSREEKPSTKISDISPEPRAHAREEAVGAIL